MAVGKKKGAVARAYRGRTYTKPGRSIGPGKRGTAKRKIYKTGGGKTALKTFKSFGAKRKRTVIRRHKKGVNPNGITGAIGKVRRKRVSKGKNPTTGKKGYTAKSAKPVTNKVKSRRVTPLRARTF